MPAQWVHSVLNEIRRLIGHLSRNDSATRPALASTLDARQAFPVLLQVLIDFLAHFKEPWEERLKEDLERWYRTGDVEGHLSHYGGMGSINDLIICQANQHPIMPWQEPWANRAFMALKGYTYLAAFTLCSSPSRPFTIGDASAIGFEAKEMMGWSCQSCRHDYLDRRGLAYIAASLWMEETFVDKMVSGCLSGILNQVIHCTTDEEILSYVRNVAQAADKLNLPYLPEDFNALQDSCPYCLVHERWSIKHWTVYKHPLRFAAHC